MHSSMTSNEFEDCEMAATLEVSVRVEKVPRRTRDWSMVNMELDEFVMVVALDASVSLLYVPSRRTHSSM